METNNKQNKQQVINEIITLVPYLNNKKSGLNAQSKKELLEGLATIKNELGVQ